MQRVFGLDDFRPGQEDVIRSALAGQHTLAIMPTGAGKSLCYQLPALLLPGMTLVVSPLIALIKDQIDKLDQLGVEASQVNSAQSTRETDEAIDAIACRRTKFVLTTPERVTQPEFLETLRDAAIGLVVIDEAHCISEWGHDFRPAYLDLGRVVKALGSPPVIALTATATPAVIDDIRKQLALPKLHVVNTGIFRPNLVYEAVMMDDQTSKQAKLLQLLQDIPGIGIVYTSTVKDVQVVTALLEGHGIPVARYHGRLATRERHANQERFMRGELKAMVATNAFGMGIDKPDIRFVIHYNLPGSVDAYYQESGRAGRDGEPARCVLLYTAEDRRTHLFFLARKYPRVEHFVDAYRALTLLGADRDPVKLEAIVAAASRLAIGKARVVLSAFAELDVVADARRGRYRLAKPGLDDATVEALGAAYDGRQQNDRAKLDRMIAYAQSALCRWRLLLEAFEDVADVECGECDNCRRNAQRDAIAAAS